MVIFLVMVIVGAITILSLPIAQFPKSLAGDSSPGTMSAGRQTLRAGCGHGPSEQQMSGVDNMNYMYSLNATGIRTRPDRELRHKNDPNTI